MQIDYALILAAGLGTRMGELGKKKPKPLWPVFNKTLLELQIRFCHELGVRKIYINAHFLAAELELFLKEHRDFGDVVLLKEDPLLDSGGAIHNLASRGEIAYSGNLLLVNADQFLFFDKNYYRDGLNALESHRAALFGIRVSAQSNYNEIKVNSGCLSEIIKPDGRSDYLTYSGLGLLKLDGLSPIAGISKFFESVANYKKERIHIISPEIFEYWDFGTAEVYLKSIRSINKDFMSGKKTNLLDFLEKNKVNLNGSEKFYSVPLNSIDLNFNGEFKKNSIHFNKVFQEVSQD